MGKLNKFAKGNCSLVVPFCICVDLSSSADQPLCPPRRDQANPHDGRSTRPHSSLGVLRAKPASRRENAVTQAGKGAEAGVESHQLGVRGERESGKIGVLPAFGLVGKRGAESAEMELKTFRLVLEAEALVPEERVPRFPGLESALYIGTHGDEDC